MSLVRHCLQTGGIDRYLEGLMQYMENYTLRIKPLLDITEVSMMMMMKLTLAVLIVLPVIVITVTICAMMS